MKTLLSALVLLSFCFSATAQKTPPGKNKINNSDINKTNPEKSPAKKEVKSEGDSTKVSVNMDKPLDQYFDSIKLSKEQIEKIAKLDEMQTQRASMSRAKSKMTADEIASEEKEDMQNRNNKIYDVLTAWQTREIYLLQNGKLKTGRDLNYVINHMDLKPSQQEEIKKIQQKFQVKFNEANKIEDELSRIKAVEKLNTEMEKGFKSLLNSEQAQMFDEIKSGKIDPTTDKEKKEIEVKSMENMKKG